jgi:hypothetical protein
MFSFRWISNGRLPCGGRHDFVQRELRLRRCSLRLVVPENSSEKCVLSSNFYAYRSTGNFFRLRLPVRRRRMSCLKTRSPSSSRLESSFSCLAGCPFLVPSVRLAGDRLDDRPRKKGRRLRRRLFLRSVLRINPATFFALYPPEGNGRFLVRGRAVCACLRAPVKSSGIRRASRRRNSCRVRSSRRRCGRGAGPRRWLRR